MAYGWQIEELCSKSNSLSSSRQSLIEKKVYQEMLLDCSEQQERIKNIVSRTQFKRALNHFQAANYKSELDMILYFGSLISCLDLDLPNPLFGTYDESEVINLAKTYMRKNEPNDYPYFKNVVKCQEKIQFCYFAPKTTFLGKSYFLDRDNYYILINSVNGIQDAVTLLHEYSHVENYLKYGINLSKYYAELVSMTREHYSFDTFRNLASSEDVEKQRNISLNHYLMRILKLYRAILLILELQKSPSQLKQIMGEFEAFCSCFDITYLYELLTDNLEIEIGYALSFIASLDIYSHCTPKESNLFITSYQIGTRTVTPKVIDSAVRYIITTLSPYQKVKIV